MNSGACYCIPLGIPLHCEPRQFTVDERLSVKAHITSLASDAVTDDVKEYFKTQCDVMCEDEVELSAVLLGGGKAELTLRGISALGEAVSCNCEPTGTFLAL